MQPWRAALLVALSCMRPEPEEIATSEERELAGVPLVQVVLSPAEDGGGLKRATETRGLVTALLELGLCDLEGVWAEVKGGPPSPALGRAVVSGGTTYTAEPRLTARDGMLELAVVWCDPTGSCATTSSTGRAEQPELVVAGTLDEATVVLDRFPTPDAAREWLQPVSKDPYATLLSGRAAAAAYGFGNPAGGANLGDPRRDPLDRAVFVDPRVSVAAWLLARRDLARGEPERARVPLPRARAGRPASAVLAAEHASVLDRTASARVADAAWDEVRRMAPADPRFTVAAAASTLRIGDPAAAAAELDALPLSAQEDPAVLALRVGIADAGSGAGDDLLARWQDSDRTNPEPVRRRIALELDEQDYAGALALVPELRARGARTEAEALEVPLALGAERFDLALDAARGKPDLERRIALRIRLRDDPADFEAADPKSPDPYERLVRGQALLAAGRATAALKVAEAELKDDPWRPESLALQVAALRALGKEESALRQEQALRSADPGWKVRSPEVGLEPAPDL